MDQLRLTLRMEKTVHKVTAEFPEAFQAEQLAAIAKTLNATAISVEAVSTPVADKVGMPAAKWIVFMKNYVRTGGLSARRYALSVLYDGDTLMLSEGGEDAVRYTASGFARQAKNRGLNPEDLFTKEKYFEGGHYMGTRYRATPLAKTVREALMEEGFIKKLETMMAAPELI